jgi:hypothetical protein
MGPDVDDFEDESGDFEDESGDFDDGYDDGLEDDGVLAEVDDDPADDTVDDLGLSDDEFED